ncbi:hypothetical protein [Streptomyces sp. NPDC101132]|uniref:hypothetical protein n=1 Tax=Streptomyces sp. NPDC101132 TaxID=3366110 RepID=UPI00381DD373
MNNATSSLPVLARTELDIFDADQRRRLPACEAIARMATAPVSIGEHTFTADAVDRVRHRADELAAGTPALTPRAARVLAGIEDAKQGQPSNVCTFWDTVARQIRKAGDSAAVLDRVTTLLSGAEEPPAAEPCARFGWCAERGAHKEHRSAYVEAADQLGLEGPSSCSPLYAAIFAYEELNGGAPVIGFLDLDLTPAEARGKVAKLRAHLDAVEALIDTAETSAIR